MSSSIPPDDIREEHGFADSDGVRIHAVGTDRCW